MKKGLDYTDEIYHILETKPLKQLRGKDFLRSDDVNVEQTFMLYHLAERLKQMHQSHIPLPPLLNQKTVTLFFEQPSTRTRVSFDAGIHLLHGHSLFIDKSTTQMGRGEDMQDTALTLSRYTDCIMARVFEHKELETMAKYSDKPIVNGLTNEDHPCQILSDLFTIREHFKRLNDITLMYAGVSDNITDSLLIGCSMLGVNMYIASPKQFPVSQKYLKIAHAYAKKTGAEIRVFNEMPDANTLKKVNVVYTDEWESMHMKLDKKKLHPILSKFQLNEKLLSRCARGAVGMHCLPALKGEEVSHNVMYAKNSLVWEQARNRMYVQMALLSAILRN